VLCFESVLEVVLCLSVVVRMVVRSVCCDLLGRVALCCSFACGGCIFYRGWFVFDCFW